MLCSIPSNGSVLKLAVPFHGANHKKSYKPLKLLTLHVQYTQTDTIYFKKKKACPIYTKKTDTIRQKNTITLFKGYYFALRI